LQTRVVEFVIPEKLTFAIMGMETDGKKMFDWFRSDQPAADVGGKRFEERSLREHEVGGIGSDPG
jgi:hypothetical protein